MWTQQGPWLSLMTDYHPQICIKITWSVGFLSPKLKWMPDKTTDGRKAWYWFMVSQGMIVPSHKQRHHSRAAQTVKQELTALAWSCDFRQEVEKVGIKERHTLPRLSYLWPASASPSPQPSPLKVPQAPLSCPKFRAEHSRHELVKDNSNSSHVSQEIRIKFPVPGLHHSNFDLNYLLYSVYMVVFVVLFSFIFFYS